MAITARLARAWTAGAVICLTLLGSAMGALGAQAGAGALGVSRSVPHPGRSSGLTGLSCPLRRSCWAVGFYGTGIGPGTTLNLNQALSWNGRKWSVVATPNPAGTTDANNTLASVTCAASAECWAVGWYGPIEGGKPAMLNQALHWNGTRWSLG